MKLSKILKTKSIFINLYGKTKLKRLAEHAKKYPSIWSKIFYKEYPRYPQIVLPVSTEVEKTDLFRTLISRKSTRKFSNRKLGMNEISKLLFFSAGIKSTDVNGFPKRVYPSAGARYPLETYIIILRHVSGLEKGIYHYNIKMHSLETLRNGNLSKEIELIAGGVNRDTAKKSAFFMVVTAVFGRTEIKYGKTSFRLILLEGGHLAQNVALVASALGLGSCFIGGFIDDYLTKLLELDPEKELPIYIIALGKMK